MGAGTAGDFGNTKGSRDNIKAALKTLGTIIDVADTVNDLRSLSEDIKEKDWVSVGLDTLGIMPLVGKIVDNAKIADNAVNAIKATNKTTSAIKIPKLPKTPSNLIKNGWTETTHTAMKKNSASKIFENNGLKIRFDKGKPGAKGYKGKDHYHIFNPSSTGKHDLYLDKLGNPVPKNSKKSHIIP